MRANTYFIDKDDESELARLIMQDNAYNSLLPLLPKEFEPLPDARVLDLACGPGGWPLQVSHQHREMSVIGIDLAEQMITYARAQAEVRNLKTQFRIMDMLQLPWEFPDFSFDFINARFITSLTPREHLPALYQECWRVLRSGGVLRYTEGAGISTPTASATQQLTLYANEAAYKGRLSFSPHDMGTGAVTSQILKHLGFHISLTSYVIDLSAGSLMHRAMKENWFMSISLLKPFLLRTKVASSGEEIDRLQEAFAAEWNDVNFCGHYFVLSVTAIKP